MKFLSILLLACSLEAALIPEVRALLSQKNFQGAEQLIASHRGNKAWNPELLEAQSWLGRGALAAKEYDKALGYADETRKLCYAILRTQTLDAEKHLPIALGATIEVTGQAMAGKGELGPAVAYLRGELKKHYTTSIRTRIQKNINLLSLEGKTAPVLETKDSIGNQKPISIASLKGHPVLMFFWAHWCGDCRAEAPIVSQLARQYESKGLRVIGPTQYYGYVAGGKDAEPAEEKAYIATIHERFYGDIPSMSVPLSVENFKNYGASSTPTLVLVDKAGIVRMYHPGSMPREELQSKIEALL